MNTILRSNPALTRLARTAPRVPEPAVLSALIAQAGEQRRDLGEAKKRFEHIVTQQNATLEAYTAGTNPDAFQDDAAADRHRDVVDALEAVLAAIKNAEKSVFVVERNLVTVLGYNFDVEPHDD